jgi:stage IV sporulation protein FB
MSGIDRRAMKKHVRIGGLRMFGAPVYFHMSVFIVVALVMLASLKGIGLALVGALSYIGVLLLHEAGHALFARWQGLRPRMIRITAIHGVCEFDEPETAKQDYIVAWGGVAAQLAVAIPLIALNGIFGIGNVDPFGPLVAILGYISIGIAAFNLIPAPELDGAKAWRLIPLLLEERRERRFVPSRRRRRKFWLIK